MANNELSSDSAGLERNSLAPAEANAQKAAAALTRDFLESPRSDLSFGQKTAVTLGAALEGTVQNGLDQVVNHPGQVATEVLGAVALGVAMRGPVWAKAPALAFAAVGTVSFGKHVIETGIETTNILGRMNSGNLEESRNQLKAQLGPLIFDTALMAAAGAGGAKLGEKLPAEFSQLKLASTLNLAKERLGDFMGGGDFPPGMMPAYAGVGGRTPGFRIESVMPRPKAEPIVPNVMQMSADGVKISGDGIRVKTGQGFQGEVIHTVDHVPAGRRVQVSHDGGAVTTIASDGKVTVGFASGEGRRFDLGQSINRLVMTEYPNGLKQFRFNDKLAADLEVDNSGHTIRALLGNGDHLHMLDNVQEGYMHFPHKDGLQTWVEHSGRVVMQLPGSNKIHEVKIPDKLAYIRLVEKADGSKEFRFLNDSGTPVAQKIQLPPTPELQQVKAPDEMQNWHDLRNYIAAKQQARQNVAGNIDDGHVGGGGVYRIEPSAGGVAHYDHNHSGNQQHPIFRMPTSIDRVAAHEIAGVPYGIMRHNDLSAPADMELAMQGHGWVITNYLDRLDFQEEVHHDYY
ncbi:MAG: hypothetical protein JST01_16190 [Cyanobacteria bacterium SZAS TMP-1]|nr:hypothetical protein [Cyanobacteria bacterium SZAS TMP-1]